MEHGSFECGCCHKTIQRGRPHDEAMAEAKEEFPLFDVEKQGVEVCDDCYNIVIGNLKKSAREN
jgi:hypothetical protein